MSQGALILTVVHDASDAENRLLELGLSVALLTEVVQQGEYARAEATNHDPLPAAGMDAYRYRVRALRDALCPAGWKIERERGLEITRSPCGRNAVITRGGDDGVGIPDAHPQPSGKVGDTTCDAVDANANRLLDPNWMNVSANDGAGLPADDCDTWMLLVRRVGDSARAELSLPTGIEESENGTRVLGWAERILLPVLDFTNEPGRANPNDFEAPVAADPTVVRRR